MLQNPNIPPTITAKMPGETHTEDVSLRQLVPADLQALLWLQTVVIEGLAGRAWLRMNTAETFAACLQTDGPHTAFGVFDGSRLIAAAVLYDGDTGPESIRRYFTHDTAQLRQSINLKLVLTDPAYRRCGLGVRLVDLLNQHAAELPRTEILSTIHPENIPSQSLFRKLGYQQIGEVDTKYGQRLVYGLQLP